MDSGARGHRGGEAGGGGVADAPGVSDRTPRPTSGRLACMSERYESFSAFYRFYLSEHRNRTCRRLHFAGTSLGVVCLALALASGRWWLIPVGLVTGYAFAWSGHFFFEKNRPATFRYPALQLPGRLGDVAGHLEGPYQVLAAFSRWREVRA